MVEKSQDPPRPDLARYRSHKEVRAGKIIAIEERAVNHHDSLLVMEHPAGAKMGVTREWMARQTPEVGGYLVCFGDGYMSYYPAEPFEQGYDKIYD